MTQTLEIAALIPSVHFICELYGIIDLKPVWQFFRPIIAWPCVHNLPHLSFIKLTSIVSIWMRWFTLITVYVVLCRSPACEYKAFEFQCKHYSSSSGAKLWFQKYYHISRYNNRHCSRPNVFLFLFFLSTLYCVKLFVSVALSRNRITPSWQNFLSPLQVSFPKLCVRLGRSNWWRSVITSAHFGPVFGIVVYVWYICLTLSLTISRYRSMFWQQYASWDVLKGISVANDNLDIQLVVFWWGFFIPLLETPLKDNKKWGE